MKDGQQQDLPVAESAEAEKKKEHRRKVLRGLALSLALLLLALCIVFFWIIFPVLSKTPELNGEYRPIASTRLYDRHGKLITTLHGEENRIVVPISELPPHVWKAFVAAEDIRFFEHPGIDARGLVRAIWTNLTSGELLEGGSTITQQFVKNALLSQERTFTRKIQEAVLSFEVERRYDKMKILELYLNQIYFGEGAYGIQTAAQLYFGKDAKDLTVSEAAVLAGIPKRPSSFNPFRDIEGAPARKEAVLMKMIEAGYLTPAGAETAMSEPIKTATERKGPPVAPYFSDYILQELLEKFGADKVYKEGLEVHTSLDLAWQEDAEKIMERRLPKLFIDSNKQQQAQGALVTIDPSNGYIRVMVGGRGTDKYNRAVLAERQPGSAFKPFVYLVAMDMGISPEALVEDKAVAFGSYAPKNYAGKFYGKVTLRTALEQSLNVIAVRLSLYVGPEKVVEYAKKLGITTLVESGPYADTNAATALGGVTNGITPLEMASAYGVLANTGMRYAPHGITKVVDRSGDVIFEDHPRGEQVVSAAATATLVDMMQGVISRGTGAAAGIGRPAAGKTGTTDNYVDAWFVGFTPDLVTAVWIGCDDNSRLPSITGGDVPAVIWGEFMGKAHANIPVHKFPTPKPGEGSIVLKGGKVLSDPEKALGDDKDVKPLSGQDVTPMDSKKPPAGGTIKPPADKVDKKEEEPMDKEIKGPAGGPSPGKRDRTVPVINVSETL